MRRLLLVCVSVCAAALAQRVQAPPESGPAGLELALRRVEQNGVFLITNAHPDDENNALIVMLARGLGVRVVELTATRGEGGQNDLGPESGFALSVLRTEELLATHAIDGAEQVFGRAVDFGYSFSVEETYQKWGYDEILDDFVRVIRMVRPDVILSMDPDGGGGGQHHQATARITRDAFDAAADPARFPKHRAAGLEPWRAARLYVPLPAAADSAPAPRSGDVVVDLDRFDEALGATWQEVGTLARSMHKTQGMARLLALPGPAPARYRLAAGAPPPDGAPPFGGFPVAAPEIRAAAAEARAAARTAGLPAALPGLVRGLRFVRAGRARDPADPVLARKEREIVAAIRVATGLRCEAIATPGVVAPGRTVEVELRVANRCGAVVAFERIAFAGFDAQDGGCATRPSSRLGAGEVVACKSVLRIPAGARPTLPHWRPHPEAARTVFDDDVPFGVPFRETPFRAVVHLSCEGEPISVDVPVEARDGSDPLAGEKRHEILVVPEDGGEGAVTRLEYGHIRRRHVLAAPVRAAAAARCAPACVGVVRSVADRIEDAILRAGASPVALDVAALRELRPERVPVVVVASRALELDARLRRAAPALVDYVAMGGVVVVLYQRSGLDASTLAPFPAKTGGARATDENGAVTVLRCDHPVFTTPHRLTASDWSGWVSERGRSFFETTDGRYVDLLEVEDPFPFNAGRKRGVLVEARHGRGRFLYVGLALSRQLDAGVVGAERLFANLLSLRR